MNFAGSVGQMGNAYIRPITTVLFGGHTSNHKDKAAIVRFGASKLDTGRI